jgi:hypothetical protein
MAESSRYPSYDVWEQHGEWDEHTRQIVGKRRMPDVAHRFLTEHEAMTVQAVASLLVDDIRLDVLTYVTQHVDEGLASPIGESQRKAGVPEKQTLYRQGLTGLDETSEELYQSIFVALPKERQIDVLSRVESGRVSPTGAWAQVPAKDFFKKMLYDVVSAYYSHPLIWSEIGYGGPAYPRGYVRVEKGLVDPWEAKQDGK